MTNEAAERLLLQWFNDVTFALAAERRATVERLRAKWFDHDAIQDNGEYHCGCEGAGNHMDISADLDEEAAR